MQKKQEASSEYVQKRGQGFTPYAETNNRLGASNEHSY